jgi:valyl-tRNA synthetase
MPHELSKQYDPAAIEPRWAEFWLKERLFSTPTPKPGEPIGRVFSILLPPPNITGRLHMGHMLEHTQMDLYTRWQRMRGAVAVWVPGTDHASIATQMLLERQLASEGVSRKQLGREKFLERAWKWRDEFGGAIIAQMERIGDSVDWDRLYFTMDEQRSRTVREVFVRMWEDGLIYRGRYIVNWCPRCGTAISDLEVAHEDIQGKLYEIRYPLADGSGSITVATTRPETMLGDTAVAVNPNDERYRAMRGKKVRLPLMNREIPIILDELAQPEFGTGAVKVTPAHDPNDYKAGLRHDLPQIDVMDETARMNQNAGPYAGLDRFEARDRVVNDLRDLELLVGIKDHVIPLGHCSRCKTVVEPRLSTQWFVAVNKTPKSGGASMAQRAREAASGDKPAIRIVPDNNRTVYLQWMENLYDWCISRQLWWGHRIPAWHCGDCHEITVDRADPTKCAHCGSAKLEQDTDVLDTWFSSGMLPFTVFGWPEKTRELELFYPTTLLITGVDILFFWMARMILMGCYCMADHHQDADAKRASGFADATNDTVPFRNVYIHALVRDADRQKMSKTKGNVMDPLEVNDRYGTDAVRFTLASMAAPGTDIAFNESRTEGYRAFANKIWNAARFLFMNIDRAQESGAWDLGEWSRSAALRAADTGEVPSASLRPGAGVHTGIAGIPNFDATLLEDRWILSRLNRTVEDVNKALEEFRFHEAALDIYHFFWNEFCDWYIELTKLRMNAGTDDAAKASTRTALDNIVSVFEASLRLLSPIMPFLTEEIWHAVFDGKPPKRSIALAAYPESDARQVDLAAEAEMAVLIDLIVAVRNVRAELKVETRATVPIQVFSDDQATLQLVRQNQSAIQRLANVERIEEVKESLAKAVASRSTARFDVAVIYEKKVDVAAERTRLTKDLERYTAELGRAKAQLSNEGFLAKAPAKVVEGLRKRAAELEVLIRKSEAALKELGT